MADPNPSDDLHPHELDALRHVAEALTGKRGEKEPPAPWETREIRIVLPMAEALAMRMRARQFDLEHGGRFQVRTGAVALWSRPERATGEPIGIVWIHWGRPTTEQAELFRIEWDPHYGGSETKVWRALEVLAGRSLR